MSLEALKKQADQDNTTIRNLKDLEKWRIKYLGRKSDLSLFFDAFKKLSPGEKKEQGKKANQVRQFLFTLYEKQKSQLEKIPAEYQIFDITRPGQKTEKGHLHPLTLVLREISHSFEKMGFEIVLGPHIETEYYNFDALRIPPNHPARDMWDTLWLRNSHKIPNSKFQIPNSRFLLRTHTSPMQIRYMETHEPPFRIIVPGKCFRFEATDAHHEIQFHQIEGLMIGENISLANLKFIIKEVIDDIFKHKVDIRFRPSYFPFVAPGLEIDIKPKNTSKKPKSKWLEIMGAGMVHPDLLKTAGYNKNLWQGFAFGLGVERIAMIKYSIDDIRLFFGSDIRFLKQF